MTSVSLFVLIGSIVVGIWRRMNVGVIAVGMSLVLAEIAGIPTKQVYGGFPTKLFVTLLGTMLFFSLLQKNKTLEVISDFTVQSIGKRLFLLPFVVYMLAFMLSAAGPGAIPVLPIAIIIGVTLAKQLDISPVLMGGCATLGAVGGTLSPLALTGIIVQEMLTEQGIAGMEADLFIKGTIINLVGVISLYIFYKGYTLKALVQEKRRITFNKNQKISVVLLMFLVIMVIGFNFDVGLVGFFLAMVLLAVKGSDEKSGISQIPWSVIIMVCGVNVLMTLVQKLGGVKLLANFLANFMSEQSAAAIMALTGGIMSQFSSANGVVIPTLVPTATDIALMIPGVSVHELVFAITFAAVVTLSPLSTAGSLIMATYTQGEEKSPREINRLFTSLFVWTFVMLIGFALICGLGYYNWISIW